MITKNTVIIIITIIILIIIRTMSAPLQFFHLQDSLNAILWYRHKLDFGHCPAFHWHRQAAAIIRNIIGLRTNQREVCH